MTDQHQHSEIVEAEGHLIDSNLLNVIFDKVIERAGTFEVQNFSIGRTNEDMSRLRLKVTVASEKVLQQLLEDFVPLGCYPLPERDALLRPAPSDGCVSPDFYSTTNLRTRIRMEGRWVNVDGQRMDAVIVVTGDRAECRKLRDVQTGDEVVCGSDGIRVIPEFRERDRLGFAFMTNDISSERRVEVSAGRVASMMHEVKAAGGRIIVVAGPLTVHTGGVGYFSEIIRMGYVDAVLAGNALAVHDVELAMFGTSLGVDLESGATVEDGHRNHMRAINAINSAGGLASAVSKGVLMSGVMYECVKHDVNYVLAGSIRDDGPLLDTEMNLAVAQELYAEQLKDVSMVVMLASMLHSIGVGNMLPAWVRVVCVDINPAVVTKLADRGSSQTAGIVTDVGLFLQQLSRRLSEHEPVPRIIDGAAT